MKAIDTRTIPVLRPLLPTADKLLPYLRRIDTARYYSNHGPMLMEFEQRLIAHFGLSGGQLTTASNGTTALSAALLAAGARPGSKCLVPSWTFVASAAAIWAAGLRPHFVDVSEQTWMLDPAALRERADLGDVGAVMVVSAFGAPVPGAAWDDFSRDTGIVVIIDGAAAFDSTTTSPTAGVVASPTMISLHATKVFGVGEGALVLSTDRHLITRVRDACNFGFEDGPEARRFAFNGKLSEYHAAVGLATLDDWSARRSLIDDLTLRYVSGLRSAAGFRLLPGYGDGWVSCYCNVVADEGARNVVRRLAASGIETRRWWQSGVHVQQAYRDCTRDDLPITETLAEHVVGLPFYHDLASEEADRVLDALTK